MFIVAHASRAHQRTLEPATVASVSQPIGVVSAVSCSRQTANRLFTEMRDNALLRAHASASASGTSRGLAERSYVCCASTFRLERSVKKGLPNSSQRTVNIGDVVYRACLVALLSRNLHA